MTQMSTANTNDVPVKSKKRYHRIKTDLGTNFVAPDGGWGWAVCVATGMTYLCMAPVFTEFGLLFKDHFKHLGFSNTQITTLLNLHVGLSTFSGLLNGPIFRRYTFRQVALAATISSVLGTVMCSFAESFITYAISYSFLYGIGRGYNLSAASLALNTYFKKKRRRATGLSWTITSLGPIIMPYITTLSLTANGVSGTVLLYAGLTMNCIACALIYQPVLWHTRQADIIPELTTKNEDEEISRADSKILIETSVLMTLEANSGKQNKNSEIVDKEANMLQIQISNADVFRNENVIPDKKQHVTKERHQNVSVFKKICAFFEFDLLKDYTLLALILGLTMTKFCEINFNILIPFIISDLGYDKSEIALLLSLLGVMDTISRFLIPFISEKIDWENKTFFLIGIVGLAAGRILLITFDGYTAILICFVWIGIFRGLRTVFMTLVIPSHVPLDRLPAASGLQLLASGIFSFTFGPFLGAVRDSTNYQVFLNCLNIGSLFTVILWTAVYFFNRKLRTSLDSNKV